MRGMTKTVVISAVVMLTVSLGALTFLALGAEHRILSPREVAAGLLMWMVGFIVWSSFVRRRVAREARSHHMEARSGADDISRRRRLRSIRFGKVWIGVLVVLLPIGIVIGVRQHEYLPMLSGGGMSLLTMYVIAKRIERLKRMLDLEPLMRS